MEKEYKEELYKESVAHLLDIPRFTKKTSLDNTKHLLEILGNPQEGMKVIHVAGTNGKGSVCAFIAKILETPGNKVALFTSPHLVKINERMKINGKEISDVDFYKCEKSVREAVKIHISKGYEHPAFFEYVFAMAMVYFKMAGTDYVVLETGLGGRLDSTNIFEAPLLTVITSISLDHTQILGDTLSKIAGEKAGIIKQNVPLVFLADNEEVCKILKSTAKKCNSRVFPVKKEDFEILKITDKDIDFCLGSGYYLNNVFTVPFVATYQVVNAAIAIKAAEVLGIKNYEKVRTSIANVMWEGRMEQVIPGVYIDGAHNPDGVAEFIKAVKLQNNSGRKILVMATANDKDFGLITKEILEAELFDIIYITKINNKRALDTTNIKMGFECAKCNVYETDKVEEALDVALSEKKPEDIIFCAGSLYLIGEVKEYFEKINC